MLNKSLLKGLKLTAIALTVVTLVGCAGGHATGTSNSQATNELQQQINQMTGAPAKKQTENKKAKTHAAAACKKWCHDGWCSTHCPSSSNGNKL